MRPDTPYKGLAAFDDTELDEQLFFGRERDTEIVVANVIASRLTVLYGPSGVGKSSLVRASVARRLRALPEEPVVVVFSRWSESPAALATAVAEAAGVEDGDLQTVVDSARRDVYLLLDQTEEYFLYHPRETDLERSLADLVTLPLRVNVLLSVREDALARLDRFKGRIPGLYGNVLRLDRLDRESGRLAIVNPLAFYAASTGVLVEAEPGFVEGVLSEVGAGRIETGLGGVGAVTANGGVQRIEAPYLQLVMERVWDVERSTGSTVLRRDTLESLGGARSIVRHHLERAVSELTPGQQLVAASLFTHLVTPSGTKISHEVGDLAEYAGATEAEVLPVVASLVDSRILQPVEGGRVEIFHDVLAGEVLAWRSRYEERRALERARAEHRRRLRRLGFLAATAVLVLALIAGAAVYALDQRNEAQEQAQLAAEQQVLVARSERKLESLRRAAVTQRARLVRLRRQTAEKQARVVALTVEADQWAQLAATNESEADEQAATVQQLQSQADEQTIVVDQLNEESVASRRELTRLQRQIVDQQQVLSDQRREADRLISSAESKQLVAASASELEDDPELSLLLARDALERYDSELADSALRTALLESHVRWARNTAAPVTSVAYSGDGQSLAAGGSDGNVHVYAVGGDEVGAVEHGSPVTVTALSNDGATALTAGSDGIARLWPLERTPSVRAAPVALSHGAPIVAASFDPTERLVVTAGGRNVKVWNATTGRHLRTLIHGAGLGGAEVSSDGSRLLTWAGTEARLYDLQTGELRHRLEQEAVVEDAALSDDGARVVTAGRDGVARVWTASTGVLEKALRPHELRVLAVAIGSDGRQVATASADGGARVWRQNDHGDWVEQAPLLGHSNIVTDIAFSPDGEFVLTASRDGTARVWEADTAARRAILSESHHSSSFAAFSPSGARVLTGGADGRVRSWTSGIVAPLQPTDDRNDRTLVGEVTKTARAAGRQAVVDGKVVRLELDGKTIVLSGHTDVVNSVRFSPDGRTILTAGRDHRVRTWDAVTGKPKLVIEAHQGAVADARFSPDGRWIVSAGPRAAGLWRAPTGAPVALFLGPRPPLAAVTFRPDSRGLIAQSKDGSIYSMTCEICGTTARVVATANARLSATGRRLTDAERRRYLG